MSMSCYRHQQLGFGILLECLFPYWSTHSELGEPCPRSLVRNAGKATSRRRRSALTVGPANRPPITTQQGFRRCSALHHSPSSPSSEPLSKLCLAYYEEARRRAIDRTKTRSIATRDRIFHGLDSVCRSNWKPTRNRPGSNGNRWTTCLRAGALAKRYSVDRNFHSRCCGKRRHGTRGHLHRQYTPKRLTIACSGSDLWLRVQPCSKSGRAPRNTWTRATIAIFLRTRRLESAAGFC